MTHNLDFKVTGYYRYLRRIVCATRDLFAIAKFLFSVLTFTKFGTHDLCASTQITVNQIFENLILTFLAIFLNFKFGLSLWNSLNV